MKLLTREELEHYFNELKIETGGDCGDLEPVRSHIAALEARIEEQGRGLIDAAHRLALAESKAAVIPKLREVIEQNHKWHLEYDDYDGYTDSTLCDANCAALKLAEPARPE